MCCTVHLLSHTGEVCLGGSVKEEGDLLVCTCCPRFCLAQVNPIGSYFSCTSRCNSWLVKWRWWILYPVMWGFTWDHRVQATRNSRHRGDFLAGQWQPRRMCSVLLKATSWFQGADHVCTEKTCCRSFPREADGLEGRADKVSGIQGDVWTIHHGGFSISRVELFFLIHDYSITLILRTVS